MGQAFQGSRQAARAGLGAAIFVLFVGIITGLGWWIFYTNNFTPRHFSLPAEEALTRPQYKNLPWLDSYGAALGVANQTHHAVLLYFSGSAWCEWCTRLENEVFAATEFAAYAEKNLVLVNFDFPRIPLEDSPATDSQRALAARFGVNGFPAVVLLDESGHFLGKLGYREGGVAEYLSQIQKLLPAAGHTLR